MGLEGGDLNKLHKKIGGEFRGGTKTDNIKEALRLGIISLTDAIKALAAVSRGDGRKPIKPNSSSSSEKL